MYQNIFPLIESIFWELVTFRVVMNYRPRQSSAANRCQNCGRVVTHRFRQVFGDNHDLVYGCFDCMSRQAVEEGEASTHEGDPGQPALDL